MTALELIKMYDKGLLCPCYTGVIEGSIDIEHYFGNDSWALWGEVQEGKHYIYAYATGGNEPEEFKGQMPAMCIATSEDPEEESVWLYEIENV